LLNIGITKICGCPGAHFEKLVKCRVKRWIVSQRVTEGYEIAYYNVNGEEMRVNTTRAAGSRE
jgi:hypothetical protein